LETSQKENTLAVQKYPKVTIPVSNLTPLLIAKSHKTQIKKVTQNPA
jgi:hypothetical protein